MRGAAGPQAIIGTIGDIDSYQLPDSKGYTAFMRHVLKISDEERQQRREQVLGTTLKDFRCAEQSHAACQDEITDVFQPVGLSTKHCITNSYETRVKPDPHQSFSPCSRTAVKPSFRTDACHSGWSGKWLLLAECHAVTSSTTFSTP